jgi:transposase
MGRRPRQYTEEYKRQVVAQTEVDARSVAELAHELGLSKWVVYKWREQYKATRPATDATDEQGLAAENRRLKRELEIAQQERDILKKAVRVFSQEER